MYAAILFSESIRLGSELALFCSDLEMCIVQA